MDYLIRFAQSHETFRLAEIEALGTQVKTDYAKLKIAVEIDVLDYRLSSPHCIVRFQVHPGAQNVSNTNSKATQDAGDGEDCHRNLLDSVARDFISSSFQAKAIYSMWGQTSSPSDEPATYAQLHEDVRRRSQHLWKESERTSFKFLVHAYLNKRSETEQREIINGFRYLGFRGKVDMKRPKEEWGVMEEWVIPSTATALDKDDDEGKDVEGTLGVSEKPRCLSRIFLGRKVGTSRRNLIEKHDLKKRPYISTTSMDAELALITANLALAGPGKLFLDPFCGTGGFMVAAAELGASVLGHDIDGRSFRGKGSGLEKRVGANFKKYGLTSLFGDCFTADLVNTPLRLSTRWLDGIICDPPYGVREGLKVLGSRKTETSSDGEIAASKQPFLIDGVPAHTLPGFIAPKKPYSFTRMLDDVLIFAARTLVDGGRLAFWMPSANEDENGEEVVTAVPTHSLLELKHECVQRFNKWSRRLLVYQRIPGDCTVDGTDGLAGSLKHLTVNGTTADELNPFRRRYFQAFHEKPNS